MDRRRRRTAALGLALFVAAGLAAAATAEHGLQPPLKAMNWLASAADPARVLTETPAECLKIPAGPDAALAVEVGRAAFRTPVVLGGQAARAGLSCESCHRSGRSNPDFQFPGISGAPGTADVTASLFSTHRGDLVDDPRPIPDLSGPKGRLRIDQAPATGALEPFIRGLVTEEFDGPPPPASVLAGLAAYVRALGPAACPKGAVQPVTVALMMADARRALAAARALIRRDDRPAAVVMVAAARARLGLIDERFADPGLAAERARLRTADAALADAAQALRDARPEADRMLSRALADSRLLEAALRRREAASLFDPGRLRAASSRPLAHAKPISILPGSATGPPAAAAG